MGCYDTLIMPCPRCGAAVYEQVKPGYMNTYTFGEDPIQDQEFIGEYTCDNCHKSFALELESAPRVIVRLIEDET